MGGSFFVHKILRKLSLFLWGIFFIISDGKNDEVFIFKQKFGDERRKKDEKETIGTADDLPADLQHEYSSFWC